MSFLENRHPEWTNKKNRWDFTWDNYTGEYAKHDRVELYTRTKRKSLDPFDKFLHRKVQAETVEAYMERILTSDPITLFSTAIDSINGIATSQEEDAQRDFGELGRVEPDNEDDMDYQNTIAYRLWRNADGKGTNWLPMMKKTGIKQTALHKVWGLVDGIKEQVFIDENGEEVSEVVGEASIHILDPQAVVDWFPNYNPTQVLVKESSDKRGSITDVNVEREAETYILYELDGWTRYEDVEGNAQVIDSGRYEFWESPEQERRCLPIFPVELPMPRELGYMLAMKQNHIFNAKSIRDFSVRNMSFAFLQLVADENQYSQIMSDIKSGFRVLRKDPDAQGDHGYKAPPSDYLQEAGQILEKDKADFAESAFKMYGDAAKQVTATQILHESRSGIEAFLSLLVSTLDEFENKCLFLLEQIYFDSPSSWGKAYVRRSQDFAPKDMDEALEKLTNAVRNARQVNAMSIETAVRTLHPDWSEEDVAEEVDAIREQMGAVEVPSNMVGG